MKTRNARFTLVAALGAALGFSACGGSGANTQKEMEELTRQVARDQGDTGEIKTKTSGLTGTSCTTKTCCDWGDNGAFCCTKLSSMEIIIDGGGC